VACCCEHSDEHSGYIKWNLARRPVVHVVGFWAAYFRLTCVSEPEFPGWSGWVACLLHGPEVLGSNFGP